MFAKFIKPISPTVLNLITASYIMLLLNSGFWAQLWRIFPDMVLTPAGLALAVWALTLFTLELLGPWRLQKPALILLVMTAAGANYYATQFGVLIDRDMIGTIFLTTVAETRHLITLSMVTSIGLLGVLPALLIWKAPLKPKSWRHWLWRWPVGVAVSFALVPAFLLLDFKAYSAAIRENRQLMASYQPGATITAVVKYVRGELATPLGPPTQIGLDAAQGAASTGDKPMVFVVFLGETARAQNFGLQPGARATTPLLAQREVAYFSNTHSCGTLTNVSVPCMFSHFGEDAYSRDLFKTHENLMDVIARAGFDAQWWDNNTGDQSIMRSLPQGWSRVDAAWDPAACAAGECTDEIFLPLLEKTLAEAQKNTVLVLHMIGSHGPAYYLRYPEARRLFTPDCRTAEFDKCSQDEIINAYDNSIAQTDYVLAQAIDMMAAATRVDAGLLYMSDHGESLGEGGVYLHGMPKLFAPETQTSVPFLIWLGQGYQARLGVAQDCLATKTRDRMTHDVFFHTVLGLLDVQTSIKDPALDISASCKG